MKPPAQTCIQVRAPARLHMGFLDLNGGLGRRFGSLGMGLEAIGIEVSGWPAPEISAIGPGSERAADCARRLFHHLDLNGGIRLELSSTIPEHCGLGSGTQMSLAVGTALCRLYGVSLTPAEIATALGRGSRSGIGIGTFRFGGFIVDGGRGPCAEAPPVISRLPVPDAWRCVLALDQKSSGLSGNVEQEAFTRLGPMGEKTASEICRLVLMQVLPALTERDCPAFGAGISRIQELVGGYFAPIQDGLYSSPAVAEAMTFLRGHGACGIGQSSWGPAGFAVFASETDAFQAMKLARGRTYDNRALEFVLCRASNEPALVHTRNTIVTGARGI